MNSNNSYPVGRFSAGFALAASITIVFNTALAIAKDAYSPLNKYMASLTGHHWTTHAAANIIIFIVLGVSFSKSGAAERFDSNNLINILIASVIVASAVLVGWYFAY